MTTTTQPLTREELAAIGARALADHEPDALRCPHGREPADRCEVCTGDDSRALLSHADAMLAERDRLAGELKAAKAQAELAVNYSNMMSGERDAFCSLATQAERERDRLAGELAASRDRERDPLRLLSWRGVDPDDVCKACGGAGSKTYGSTATWRGGLGGQMCTTDVCDACWGSGEERRHGADLRKMTVELRAALARAEAAERERDDAKRHDLVMEDMLTGVQAENRTLRAERDAMRADVQKLAASACRASNEAETFRADLAQLRTDMQHLSTEDERGHALIDAADGEDPDTSSADTLTDRVERLLEQRNDARNIIETQAATVADALNEAAAAQHTEAVRQLERQTGRVAVLREALQGAHDALEIAEAVRHVKGEASKVEPAPLRIARAALSDEDAAVAAFLKEREAPLRARVAMLTEALASVREHGVIVNDRAVDAALASDASGTAAWLKEREDKAREAVEDQRDALWHAVLRGETDPAHFSEVSAREVADRDERVKAEARRVALATNAALRAALATAADAMNAWTRHFSDCPGRNEGDEYCTCGLWRAREAVRAALPGEPDLTRMSMSELLAFIDDARRRVEVVTANSPVSPERSTALASPAPSPATPPCGGSRCHQADDGTWIHSSKSYGTCSVRATPREEKT